MIAALKPSQADGITVISADEGRLAHDTPFVPRPMGLKRRSAKQVCKLLPATFHFPGIAALKARADIAAAINH
jgi:hypothetical protein